MDVILVLNAGSSSLKFQIFSSGDMPAISGWKWGLKGSAGASRKTSTEGDNIEAIQSRSDCEASIPDAPANFG